MHVIFSSKVHVVFPSAVVSIIRSCWLFHRSTTSSLTAWYVCARGCRKNIARVRAIVIPLCILRHDGCFVRPNVYCFVTSECLWYHVTCSISTVTGVAKVEYEYGRTNLMQTRYAFDDSKLPETTAKSRGAYLRVHFKNTRETAAAISGMPLQKAYEYLGNVVEHKQAIPFRRFNGGVGRTPQVKDFNTTQGRWPVKSVKFLLGLLKNAEANAEAKGMEVESIIIRNIVVQQAPTTYRRTYRAHGRINPYRSSPCHIEIHLSTPTEQVQKTKDDVVTQRLNKRQLAKKRVAAARAITAAPLQK